MNEVNVDKSELLEKLKASRDSHVAIYNDAMEGFKVQFKKKLESEIKKIDDGKAVNGQVLLEMPRSHEEQYNEVIEMLEMSTDTTIHLSRHEFQQYVQDKWISQSEKNMLRTMALSSSNAVAYQ